ncbi:MAG: hypothetical protein DMF60_15730, partial [Acidobacteria bacterium]
MQELVEVVVRNPGSPGGSDAVTKTSPVGKARVALLFCLSLLALYSGLFLFYHELRFPMIWDEQPYWRTSLLISKSVIPDLRLLRNYDQLNTPLPFIIFGALEYFFKDGLFVGRMLNLVLSLIMACAIGVSLARTSKRRILAALGLVSFPYYLWLSCHLYTDIVATFFVFAGFWLWLRNRHVLSCLSFVLAIACRQYMLAFPLSLAVYEFTSAFDAARKFASVTSVANRMFQAISRCVAPSAACLTIFGWFWLFGGMAPRSGVALWITPTVQRHTWAFAVDSSLYFLA